MHSSLEKNDKRVVFFLMRTVGTQSGELVRRAKYSQFFSVALNVCIYFRWSAWAFVWGIRWVLFVLGPEGWVTGADVTKLVQKTSCGSSLLRAGVCCCS